MTANSNTADAMAATPGEENRLTHGIYAAALEPTRWPQVLAQVIALCGGRTGSVFNFDVLDPTQNFFIPHGLPAAALSEYRAKGYDQIEFEVHRDIMAPYIPGLAVAGYQRTGSQENYRRRMGSLYTEIYAPNGVEYVIGAILDVGDFKWSAIGVHRSLEQGEFSEAALSRLTRLATHMARALQVQRQLAMAERGVAPLYELLDAMNTGVVLLDGEGRLVFANRLAGAIMRAHPGLQPDTRVGLRASDPTAQARLRSLLRDALDGTGHYGGVFAAPHPSALHPLKATIVPLGDSGLHPELGREGIRVAAFITDPARARVLSETTLSRLYGLTSSESAVATLLLNESSVEDIAAQRQVSVETVRGQLKSIYAKTHTGGQVELIRLLSALANDFAHLPLPETVALS